MHIALDAVTLSEWVPSALPREVKARYYEVGKRLREYLIPTYVVEGDDTEILRNIFDRTNSTGKSLTRDEVFDALVGSQIGSTGERGFGIVHDQLRDLGFGSIDRLTILKTFEAIRGEKIGKLDPRGQDLKAAESDLLGTARAAEDCSVSSVHRRAPLRGAALRAPARGAGRPVPSVREPRREEPRSAQEVVLAGSRRGATRGASGSLQQHVDDVRPNDERGSVKRLLDRTGEARKPDLGTLARDEISIASARGKVILCALFSHAPRSLSTGDKIVPDDLFGAGTHEVMLRIVQPRESALGSTLGNRLLHPSIDIAPSRLVRECNDDGALASHAIDGSSQSALRQGDVDTFLPRRAELLAEWIRQFVDARAEWDRPDTPSIKVMAQRKTAS